MLKKEIKSIYNKFIFILGIGIFSLFFLMTSTAQASPISSNFLIKLTNNERKNYNLNLLTENSTLNQCAMNKARDILEKQYFAHTNPEGKEFYKWIDEAGYNYLYAGENLAIDFEESEDVIKAWMESELHKKNILNERYTEIGIGVLEGTFKGSKSIIIVQIFGKPFMKITGLNIPEKKFYNPLIEGKENYANIAPLYINSNFKNQLVEDGVNSHIDTQNKKNNFLAINSSNISENKNKLSEFDIPLLTIIFILSLGAYGTVMEKAKSFNLSLKQKNSSSI